MALWRVGILGLARRVGTFAEVGLRSWEEAGCAAVEQALMESADDLYVVHRPVVIRSDRAELERILRDWCDTPNIAHRCDLILTVGGTGFSPSDSVPEATRALLERDAPGIASVLRHLGGPEAAFSRGVSGMRGKALLINLPGHATGFANQELLIRAMDAITPYLPEMVSGLNEDPVPPWGAVSPLR